MASCSYSLVMGETDDKSTVKKKSKKEPTGPVYAAWDWYVSISFSMQTVLHHTAQLIVALGWRVVDISSWFLQVVPILLLSTDARSLSACGNAKK